MVIIRIGVFGESSTMRRPHLSRSSRASGNHDNQIRLRLPEPLDCFLTVTVVITNKPISAMIQQAAKARSYGRTVVRYEDPNHRNLPHPSRGLTASFLETD